MKIICILFLVIVSIASCKSSSSVVPLMHSMTEQNDSMANKYQILQIKTLEDKVYIIYAQKGDSIYKIVSEKEKYPPISCKPITERAVVSLNLVQIYPYKSLLGVELSGSYYTTVKGINVAGVIVDVDGKSNNALYKAENLNGLCFIKQESNM